MNISSEYLPNPFNKDKVIGNHIIHIEIMCETEEDAIQLAILKLQERLANPLEVGCMLAEEVA